MNPIYIKLDINNFFLYLNSVGGHSLFIEISPQYLIKSSNENEINFYLSNLNLKFNLYILIKSLPISVMLIPFCSNAFTKSSMLPK